MLIKFKLLDTNYKYTYILLKGITFSMALD